MRILVFGSRDYDNEDAVDIVLRGVLDRYPGGFRLIQGGAQGADRLGYRWALKHSDLVEHHCYEAEWEICAPDCPPGHRRKASWGEYCPTAGLRRNQRMLSTEHPSRAIGFITPQPGGKLSRGSADMKRRLDKAKVATFLVM